MRRPATVDGRISLARIHRSSVNPVDTSGFHQASCARAGMVYGVEWRTRSGGPLKRSAKFHTSSSANTAGGGSDRSFWNS